MEIEAVQKAWLRIFPPVLTAVLAIVINLLTDEFTWLLGLAFVVVLTVQIIVDFRAGQPAAGVPAATPRSARSVPAFLRSRRVWTMTAASVLAFAVVVLAGLVQARWKSFPEETHTAHAVGDTKPKCPGPATGSYAIAVGAHSNSPPPPIPPELIIRMVEGLNGDERASIVRADGSPSLIKRLNYSHEAHRSESLQNRLAASNQFIIEVAAAIDGVRADSAEAAPLAALSLAAREAGKGGAVVLLDSGLQTVAPLDFRKGFITTSPMEISTWLKENRLLPDLRERTVLLAGLGDTAAPQPSLDEALHADLVAIWQQIVKDAGASCVSVVAEPAMGTTLSGLPPVGVVPLPRTPSLDLSCRPSTFAAASAIGFVGDSTTFRNPSAARTALQSIAGEIIARNRPVTITGTSSTSGSSAQQMALSLARANAVESELVRLGVPVKLINSKGVGTDFPGFVEDTDGAGHINPAVAGQNRGVILQLSC
ncbi:hypothetical protein Acy02nite_33310 [Actinoplanes cyaneus]|uniref:OmpA-like domain-containing protein n=1 Tax=Actinoplanes cyaneus TaxID=52696 RepID=A0A919M0S9_9ACTN|nr:OmpA family protein [Actinoplanes cyaneus]MCW2140136.1 OmpA family protein [Actinoplanes cyaneus]GID65450.1 hypothetical protein Acy02nite_33310 [Actinoplanes cyaneus]